MQKPAAPQKTVLETILDWSKDRPLWQRDALRRIIANGRLTDADIGELVDLCKQGKGPPVGALKAVPLEKAHLPANPGQTAAVSRSAEHTSELQSLMRISYAVFCLNT